MKIRVARKIACNPVPSKKLHNRLHKLYPSYINEEGHYCMPSWHKYHRFAKAWVILHRKMRKYQTNFKML